MKKKNDMPAHIAPMLCTLVNTASTTGDYLFELKWDGYRIVSFANNGKVRMDSRSGLDYTGKYPPIAAALQQLKHEVIIDGEVVVFDHEGKPNFDLLQKYNGHNTPSSIIWYVTTKQRYYG